MNGKPSAFACVALLVPALPALAHHSFAMFDTEKVVTIAGTVKEFEWVNPHSWLYVMVPDATGASREWAIEMGSTGAQARVGWSADTVKPGDRVTVEMNPLRDGTRGGTIVSVTLPNGRKFGSGGQRNNPLQTN
jgi:hypothetical protein